MLDVASGRRKTWAGQWKLYTRWCSSILRR
jgi:hypothetical protein